jgi:hypothetical protein
MAGLLLKKFSNRISEQIMNEFFKNLTTFTFNAQANVSVLDDFFISIANQGETAVYNNDVIRYYTGAGGNALSGLSNGHLYKVTSANSLGFKLANVSTNSTIAILAGDPETHYIATFNPAYYFAASKHTEWPNDTAPDAPSDTLSEIRQFQREIMLGKRINRADVAHMIRKITWSSGTVYAPYDDTDKLLFEKNFYVLTEGDFNVYKCLDNNNGAPSTVKPTNKLTTKFQTADGYIWKYMYTLTSANNVKFSTSDYIPVDVNTSISAAAVNGAIEVVQIAHTGGGYTAYAAGFIQQVLSNTLFKVEVGTTATSNDYYNTSGFYIDAGTGSGQLTVVDDYIVNTSGHYIKTKDNLDQPALDTTSEYLISPQIKFTGDGTGLKAYANVAVAGGQYALSSINIINRGQSYSYCVGSVVSPFGTGAEIRPVLSPENGHGYNQPAELGASYLCISVDFSNNESTAVYTNAKFRKTGIIYAPRQFTNNELYFTNTAFNGLYTMAVTISGNGTFQEGEVIIGQTTNAHALVAWSNTSAIQFNYQHGNFQSSEQIRGVSSTLTGVVTSINTPDINKYTNEVIYYDNVMPVQRSNTSTETAKLLIAI